MFAKEFLDLVSRTIKTIEERKQPLYYWLFSWVAIVMLRMYIEDYSTGRIGVRGFFDIGNQLHEFLFYVVAFLGVVVILHIFSKEKIIKVLKSAVTFSPILLVAPIIDLIITGGKGLYMSYVYDFDIQSFWMRFITFGGTWEGGGATPGIKIEVIFILAFMFVYIFFKTRKKLLSSLGTLYAYCGLVLLGIYPLLLKQYIKLFPHIDVEISQQLDSKVFLLLIFMFTFILFWKNNTDEAKALCSQLRITRIAFYVVLLGVGFVLSYYINGSTKVAPIQVINLLITIIILVLSSIFSMMINDREDIALDRISNFKRLLPSARISERNYFIYGIIAFAFSIVFSLTLHLEIFYLVLLGNLVYFIYSAPPFSLKYTLVLSKAALATNTVIVLTLGYFLNQRECTAFIPNNIMLSLFVTVFLVGHVIDLKDHAGDKKTGRKTLSVLLGPTIARYVIGMLFIASFVGVSFILKKDIYALYSGLLGLVIGITLFKKPYNELLIFILLILSLIWFSILYFFL